MGVLYESPETMAITSDKIDVIWNAVDEIKKGGYKIDDVTSYRITTETSFDSTNYVNILVVMSK